LAAADSSIEEDRDRNMVVTTTIRATTAIVIRIMAAPLFGRDWVWRGKASVELIGCLPLLIRFVTQDPNQTSANIDLSSRPVQ
jgi:hypothetical protein